MVKCLAYHIFEGKIDWTRDEDHFGTQIEVEGWKWVILIFMYHFETWAKVSHFEIQNSWWSSWVIVRKQGCSDKSWFYANYTWLHLLLGQLKYFDNCKLLGVVVRYRLVMCWLFIELLTQKRVKEHMLWLVSVPVRFVFAAMCIFFLSEYIYFLL